MKNKNAILKAALVMGISALALTACETGDWFDDDATYAGDVKPPAQDVETAAASTQVVPPPNQEIMQTLPPSAPQPTPEFTSTLTPSTTTTVTTTTSEAPVAPPVVAQNQYTGNLASVPPRPLPSDLPSNAQVQSARQDLTSDNQRLTSTLKDPYQPVAPVTTATTPYPVPNPLIPSPNAPAPVTPAPGMTTTTVTTQTTPAPAPIQPTYAPTPQPVAQPMYAPVPAQPMGGVPAPTDQNVSGRMLGLKATGPGKYSLIQLQPDSGIGSFALTASIVAGQPGNQINITQYQDMRRVAAQYGVQKGRVRLVAYSNDPQSQEALQRATTVAAYLIDLGVPSNAIRMRIDPVAPDAAPTSPAARKTDIFLEVPVTK